GAPAPADDGQLHRPGGLVLAHPVAGDEAVQRLALSLRPLRCHGRLWRLGQDAIGERVPVETGRVLAAHQAQLGCGDVTPEALDHGLGIGPGAVSVGKIDLHHDVVDSDGVAGVDGRRVVDGAEPEVAAQHVGRANVPGQAGPGAVDDGVEAVDEHGHPADAALG